MGRKSRFKECRVKGRKEKTWDEENGEKEDRNYIGEEGRDVRGREWGEKEDVRNVGNMGERKGRGKEGIGKKKGECR